MLSFRLKAWMGVMLFAVGVVNAETLQFARVEMLPQQKVIEILFYEVAAHAKLDVKVLSLPAARANALAVAGVVAGELGRIDTYGEKNPNLIRVDPAMYFLNGVIYGKKERHWTLPNAEFLQPYRIAITRGVKYCLDASTGLKVIEIVNHSQLSFRMLDANRVDFLCTSSMDGRMTMAQLGYQHMEVVWPLGTYPLYIYLHPNFAHLRAPLSKSLLELQQSGEIARMIERAERKVIAAGADQ